MCVNLVYMYGPKRSHDYFTENRFCGQTAELLLQRHEGCFEQQKGQGIRLQKAKDWQCQLPVSKYILMNNKILVINAIYHFSELFLY